MKLNAARPPVSSTPPAMRLAMRFSAMLPLAICLALPAAIYAQTSSPVPARADKKASPPSSRTQLKSKAKQTAAGISAADAALTPGEMAIAERVYTGKLPCELGAFVTLMPDAKAPGFFDVRVKNLKFRMFPVETTTGAIRLEDRKAGGGVVAIGKQVDVDEPEARATPGRCLHEPGAGGRGAGTGKESGTNCAGCAGCGCNHRNY